MDTALSPGPYHMPILVSSLLSTAGSTSLCFFNAGIYQGWLSQNRNTEYTYSLPKNVLPLDLFATKVLTVTPIHMFIKYKHCFDFTPELSPISLTEY